MSVTKRVRSGTMATLLAVGLAACGETATAPSGLSPEVGPLLSSGSDGSGISGRGQESGTRSFVIYPGLPMGQRFGDHVLFLPANSVCDPASSGYGAALWDAPCAPLQQPIQVTATWSTVNDQPVISFSPDLRFVPSNDESGWVTLSLKASRGIDPDLYYTILWFDKEAGRWVDESANDPSLKARTSQSGNLVTRLLKHFSDYSLWAGFGGYNLTSGMGDSEWYGIGGGW